jgi:2-polyprenyl-3-methyl-5-hydroxy-6-metoxy-1,4-benzoquinol methylase
MDTAVDSIVERLGFNTDMDQRTYVREMYDRFGRTAKRFMDTVDELQEGNRSPAPHEMARAYRLQHKNWRMGKFVSLRNDGPKYVSLLERLSCLVAEDGDTVCEVGCGGGLLSCAMALLWPDTDVVGIDRIKEAVKAARLHALDQDIPNVEFVKSDIGESLSGNLKGQFDLVVCPWVMHELAPSLIESAPLPEEERTAVTNVAALVAPGGILLTVDRLPSGHEQQAPMLKVLEESGLEVTAKTNLQAGWEAFPMAVLSKG